MPHASKTVPDTQQRPAAEKHGDTTRNEAIDSSPRIATQRMQVGAIANSPRIVAQREKANRMGLPGGLKSGIESLSGLSMDHVKVHYNSSQPAQLNAHAYAQGSEIHLAPGQERHLPHEAWHVVQQARGQVRPTLQMKGGVSINDDRGLEHEADVMGAKAMAAGSSAAPRQLARKPVPSDAAPVQRVRGGIEYTENYPATSLVSYHGRGAAVPAAPAAPAAPPLVAPAAAAAAPPMEAAAAVAEGMGLAGLAGLARRLGSAGAAPALPAAGSAGVAAAQPVTGSASAGAAAARPATVAPPAAGVAALPAVAPPAAGVAAGAPVVPEVGQKRVGATQIRAYRVRNDQLAGMLGAQRNTNHELLRSGRVKLTNDTVGSEWIVEGHADNLTAEHLIRRTLDDMAWIFLLRGELKELVDRCAQNDHQTILAPDGTFTNPGPNRLFIYRPGAASGGSVQITTQYANAATIRRITELNASRYLKGEKVEPDNDTSRVAGARTKWERFADWAGLSSSVTATLLYSDLLALSQAIPPGGNGLSREQCALVRLMVVNDAMASCISRHAALLGQSNDKNLQKYFPKARRNAYVDAIAQAQVPRTVLLALRVSIRKTGAAMAFRVWDRADPFALDLTGSINEKARNDMIVALSPAQAGAAVAAAVAAKRAADANSNDAAVRAGATAAPPNQAVLNTVIAQASPAIIEGLIKREAVRARVQATRRIAANQAIQGYAAAVAVTLVDAGRDVLHVAQEQLRIQGQWTTNQAEKTGIKNFALGNNGALLANWIDRTAFAYTDETPDASLHVENGTENVIRSGSGLNPVQGGGQGAIYEFRGNLFVNEGNLEALRAALNNLFGAAD